jgi:hypothetical protein
LVSPIKPPMAARAIETCGPESPREIGKGGRRIAEPRNTAARGEQEK